MTAERVSRWLTWALLAVSGAIVLITVVRVRTAWPNEAHLGYTEGTWTAIAIDAAHGVFYRPLEGDLGYGGTRYFPLFFSLQAGLIRVGLSPIAAGHLLATVSVLFLVSTVGWLVHLAGSRPLVAATAAVVVLGCQPTQMALLTIRGDALATAFALTGVACAIGRRSAGTAALAFMLAFATKPTSLYAPVATVLWLGLRGERRSVWRLTGATAAGLTLVLVTMQAASASRALGVIGASAVGGGTWQSLLSAPLALAHILRRVPESLALMAAAVAVIMARARRGLTIEGIAFVACAVATVAIFASPATVENHLVDLTACAVVAIAGWVGYEKQRATAVALILVAGGLAAGTTAALRWHDRDRVDARTAREHVLAAVADAHTPIFVEQPILAAKAGWQTYLLDPYLFSFRIAQDPRRLDRLIDDLRRRRFGAVILEHADLNLALQDSFPDPAGTRFLAALREGYALDRVVDGRPVFRPR